MLPAPCRDLDESAHCLQERVVTVALAVQVTLATAGTHIVELSTVSVAADVVRSTWNAASPSNYSRLGASAISRAASR